MDRREQRRELDDDALAVLQVDDHQIVGRDRLPFAGLDSAMTLVGVANLGGRGPARTRSGKTQGSGGQQQAHRHLLCRMCKRNVEYLASLLVRGLA